MPEAHHEVPIWNTAGGSPNRAGFFPAPVRIDAKPVRKLAARGGMQASVVFDSQDRAFVADLAGWVQAFNLDGKPLWQRRLEGGISATPAVDAAAGLVFVGTHAGWVCGLRTADGVEQWRQRLPTKGDPRIAADLLFLPGPRWVVTSNWGGQFHALDAGSGGSRRTWDAGILPQAAASADARDNLYAVRAARGEGTVVARLSPEGGETALYRQAEGGKGINRAVVAAGPVLNEDRGAAYVLLNDGAEGERCQLCAVSLRGRGLLWKAAFGRMVMAAPAAGADGTVFVAQMDGAVSAFGPEGSRRFVYETGADYLTAGPVCDSEGTAFVGDCLGRLHVVRKDGAGRVVFEAARSIQARPSLDARRNLYLPAMDRCVYVFRNRAAV